MARKKILWLVSWYPNRNDRFDGDFIQRHSRAAALFNDIHVIFVTDALIEKSTEEEWNEEKGLTEQIIYFKKQKGLFGKVLKQLRWRKLYLNAVKKYLKKNGKPDWVHVHVPWKAGLIAMALKKKYGLDYLVTEHWGIYNDVVRDNVGVRPRVVKKLLMNIFSKAKIFISVSKYLAAGVNKMIFKKDAIIIPNVVDTTLFFFTDEKRPCFRFIHVSNMVPLKNIPEILQAAKLLKEEQVDFELIMIGNRNDEYVKLSGELNLSSIVFFRGEISYSQVAKEMQMADSFILFSKNETFSCTTAEALCCGLPVIASNVAALPELVNKENGILVENANVKELSHAMKKIMSEYKLYDRQKISNNARKKFNYEIVGQMFDEVYSKSY